MIPKRMWFTMKIFFVFTLVVVFVVIFNVSFGAYSRETPCEAECDIGKIIRLQTIAASNSDYDQYLKYEISDAVLLYIEELFDNCSVSTYEEAGTVLRDNVNNIKKISVKAAADENCFEKVVVEFIDSEYEKYSPVGFPSEVRYPVLRITVGEGKGRNCQRIIWEQKCNTENIDSVEMYSLAESVFPKDVKIDIWIFRAVKKLIASFN